MVVRKIKRNMIIHTSILDENKLYLQWDKAGRVSK